MTDAARDRLHGRSADRPLPPRLSQGSVDAAVRVVPVRPPLGPRPRATGPR
ncbi:hypothetical protein ACFSM7_13310 [Clavibacter michiganensis subsp. tessellarius]|uniref:hypothetical protein n=1 Tax=Clavibacter tessellarius TaxID=31965 RepID=UPI0036368B3E